VRAVADAGIRTLGAVPPEDLMRAGLYRLLAGFLSSAPASERLEAAGFLVGDTSGLGGAIDRFATACRATDSAAIADQYQDLFIGLGRGELIPYGSYYLTGFLQEKPLSRLRADMARLGIERNPDSAEPEDHIASECEMMAGFIDGAHGVVLPLAEQRAFFDSHMGSWAPYFFSDLAGTRTSALYAALGDVGRVFLAIEVDAFKMG
jgi:TorA maturation chaperone TorD